MDDFSSIEECQAGLFDSFADFHLFVQVAIREQPQTHNIFELVGFVQDLDSLFPETKIQIGFSPTYWHRFEHLASEVAALGAVNKIMPGCEFFPDQDAQLIIVAKSHVLNDLRLVRSKVVEKFGSDKCNARLCRRGVDGKVLGGRFVDGITNPDNRIAIEQRILLPKACGVSVGALGFTSDFLLLKDKIEESTSVELEDDVGRHLDGRIMSTYETEDHIRLSRRRDEFGEPLKMFRNAVPWFADDQLEVSLKPQAPLPLEKGIFFSGLANSIGVFRTTLNSFFDSEGTWSIKDPVLNKTISQSAGFWYFPSRGEVEGFKSAVPNASPGLNPFWQTKRGNPYIFYNSHDYLAAMSEGSYPKKDIPSDRVLGLLDSVFSRWHDHWYRQLPSPRYPCLDEILDETEQWVMDASVQLRKAYAINKTLSVVVGHSAYGLKQELLRINPSELIVGVMPSHSLGLGKRVVSYLTPQEREKGLFGVLDESSAMGHIVPDHSILLNYGIGDYIGYIEEKRVAESNRDQAEFYQSLIVVLEGVQNYIRLFQRCAIDMEKALDSLVERENLRAVAERLDRISVAAPVSFLDAAQLVFMVHCCLHITGEPVAIGRLDLLLEPFNNDLKFEETQEIVDCLWIKLSERVNLNRHNVNDMYTYGSTAINYAGVNFHQGSAMNQWVQQVTVGGYLPKSGRPESAVNTTTIACIRASRRLPLNAPCLSLRVHQGISGEVLEEASKSILSGGAHPIILHDDKIVQGLIDSAIPPADVSEGVARNYACDGCYEPMFAGASEFAFANITVLDALEMALNRGALYGKAGTLHLDGWKNGYETPDANNINSFEELLNLVEIHLESLVSAKFYEVLSRYGKLADVCPSPLLSAFIDGCLDKGRDLSAGGARYHMLAPMFVGISNLVDSLTAIRTLVFGSQETTLGDIVLALKCDWGYNVREPMVDSRLGENRLNMIGEKFRSLRLSALACAKMGDKDEQTNLLVDWIVTTVCDISRRVLADPNPEMAQILSRLKDAYSTAEEPFGLIVTPGVGTFEGYVGCGVNSGASPDGRRAGAPIASDLSPMTSPQDLEPKPRLRNIYAGTLAWRQDAVNFGLSNGAPIDMNISESVTEKELFAYLRTFADDPTLGSNLITLTCADPATYEAAEANPEKYDLVRVRTGGWSEFFVSMYPEHQKHHQRRTYFSFENRTGENNG